MIPILGMMIAAYTIARLLQVPMEMYSKDSGRWIFALVISGGAIVAILILTLDLLLSGAKAMPPLP